MVRFRSGKNASVWLNSAKCIDFKPEVIDNKGTVSDYGVYNTDDPAIIEALQGKGYQPDILSKEELEDLEADEVSTIRAVEDIIKSAPSKVVGKVEALVDKVKRLKGGKAEEPVVVEEEPEEPVLKCNVCGFVAGNAGALASHMKTHTEE